MGAEPYIGVHGARDLGPYSLPSEGSGASDQPPLNSGADGLAARPRLDPGQSVRRRDVRVAYDVFAPFYDEFTAHHRYDEWTEALEKLAVSRARLSGKRLLDVACGTGKSFMPFLSRGYAVTACDISPEMVSVARRKAGNSAAVFVADMRELDDVGQFDFVTCLDDAINYLEPDELVPTFEGFRRNLAPAGVVIFDVNSLKTLREGFSRSLVVAGPEQVLVFNGFADPDLDSGGCAHSEVVAYTTASDGLWDRRVSAHSQRHHPIAEVRTALDAAGLWSVGAYGQFTDGRLGDEGDDMRHSKIVHIAVAQTSRRNPRSAA